MRGLEGTGFGSRKKVKRTAWEFSSKALPVASLVTLCVHMTTEHFSFLVHNISSTFLTILITLSPEIKHLSCLNENANVRKH